ncbi:hypothetical protein [Pedobacter endophyticus]|uniref:Uncharacterized protein n=1 Tax=Pedobacter endophyticus TaxID=2789740 RepID=A0A7U3SQC8_9SPHI|nr:hypothetical protein [Pedobacter endophyticus]QPH38201.1 hypothetical protein IZT61_13975 [Pedobacter endophyticus]
MKIHLSSILQKKKGMLPHKLSHIINKLILILISMLLSCNSAEKNEKPVAVAILADLAALPF